jgi:hypothetical protein
MTTVMAPVTLPGENEPAFHLWETSMERTRHPPRPLGARLALAALAGFLARHPLRLLLIDRRKGTRYARTALAERFLAGYAGLGLAPAVFFVLLARSGWGLSSWRRPVRPQTLGFQELGYGLLTLTLLAVGYRVGPR